MYIYLVLQPGRPFIRDQLAALFWPDEAEKVARTNLRQTLYQLPALLDAAPNLHLCVTSRLPLQQRDADFLSTELADVPLRQRSMRRSFDYSWQLLTPAERGLFARLSVFQGSFTRQAATAVADVPLRMLARLINKSLLRYDSEADRCNLHELLRCRR